MKSSKAGARFARVAMIALLWLAGSAGAAALAPDQLVTQTTERVITLAKDAKGYYEKDPQRLNQQVDTVMRDVVDFDGFARGVMGTYASEQKFKALKTDAERTAFQTRIAKFTEIFRRGLIETYAKGLLKFNGQRIETVAGRSSVNGSNATVVQNVYGNAEKPYVIQYSLRQDGSGDWKLRNVIIEGVNLGQTYRNQFASAAEQYGGDLDRVIANWHVEPDVKPDTAKATAQ